MKYYKVMFNNAGLVSSIAEENVEKEKHTQIRQQAVLAKGEDVDGDGYINSEYKLFADRYKRLAKNIAILGFKEPLPSWVEDAVGDDLHFNLGM